MLLIRSQKRSRGKAQKGTGAPAGAATRSFWARALVWGRRLLVAGAVAGGLVGSYRIRGVVTSSPRFQLADWRLDLQTLPPWVTEDIRSELHELDNSLASVSRSLFAPGVLEEVKIKLEEHPWVRKTMDLELRYPTLSHPGTVLLELALRRPMAIVEHDALFYLVDEDGRRLGQPYREPPSRWFGVPVLKNLSGLPPPPPAGTLWSSRDLLQGVDVARILFESNVLQDFPGSPVDEIDLANLHGRLSRRESEIVLRVGKQRLAWGRSPRSADPRTVPVETLVENLRYVLGHPEAYGNYAVIHLHRPPEVLTGIGG